MGQQCRWYTLPEVTSPPCKTNPFEFQCTLPLLLNNSFYLKPTQILDVLKQINMPQFQVFSFLVRPLGFFKDFSGRIGLTIKKYLVTMLFVGHHWLHRGCQQVSLHNILFSIVKKQQKTFIQPSWKPYSICVI